MEGRDVAALANQSIASREGALGVVQALLEDLDLRPFAECVLAAIARASQATAEALLGNARPAFLSFSSGTSGAGDSVSRVAAAAAATGLPGPLQGDAALNAAIAEKKGVTGGDANCLIFPSLDAGNIAYKLCQELAGAQAVGPILQGFRRPVGDLSRGATPDDIVAVTLTTVALDRPRAKTTI